MTKAGVRHLPRIDSRATFVYFEHASISRADAALTVADSEEGTIRVPAASVACVMLGPGTSITHRAIELLADCGTTALWVGESGVKFYASGRPMSRTSAYAEAQARIVSNRAARLEAARTLYQMRFAGEDVSKLDMRELRGREGARMKEFYRQEAARAGIEWVGRRTTRGGSLEPDETNRVLSSANAALYAGVSAAIHAIGCCPALGIVHNGHDQSFVYDIADLYKTEISIPTAFRVAALNHNNPYSAVRKAMRNEMSKARLIERAVKDICKVLAPSDAALDVDVVNLWDGYK